MLLIGLLILTYQTKGQVSKPDSSVKAPKLDTVYFFEGNERYVNVKKITFDSIIYLDPESKTEKSFDKLKVHKINYSYGHHEYFNEKQKTPSRTLEWRRVKIVESKKNVLSMTRVREIEATAKGSGRGYETPKTLERKARVILRKKAARLNANYILLTKKSVSVAFGEIPSATLKGIAYTDRTTEPQQSSNRQ